MTDPYLPNTEVDLDQLADAARAIDRIKAFIERSCIGAMPPIHQALGSVTNVDMDDVDYKFTREATVFGGFYSAYGMQASHDNVYRSVHDSLLGMMEHLGNAADSLRTMVSNYQAVEERNTVIAENFQRALGSPGTGGPNNVV